MNEIKEVMSELHFADEVSVDKIPEVLRPLLGIVIDAYKQAHGDNLLAVYVHGSAARGDWIAGVSDFDTVALTRSVPPKAAHETLNKLMTAINDEQNLVPYVEYWAMDTAELSDKDSCGDVVCLAACGVRVWGEPIDFSPFLPGKEDFLNTFISHKEIYIDKTNARINEFDEEKRKEFARRSAKFAIRTLGAKAVKQGADLHTGVADQIEDISNFAPEAKGLAHRAKDIIDDADYSDVEAALDILVKAIAEYQKD